MMKETKPSWSVIKNVKGICDAIVNSHMEPKRTKLYQTTIQRLNEYFNTTEVQTWILCFGIWQHYIEGASCYMRDFSSFMEVNVLQIAYLHDEFRALKKRGFISYNEDDSSFGIENQIIRHVLLDQEIPYQLDAVDNYVGFTARVSGLIMTRKFEDKSVGDMCIEIENLESRCSKLPLVIRCQEAIQEDDIRFLFYDFCHDFIARGYSDLNETINDFYDSSSAMLVAKDFLNERNILFRKGLIEFSVKGNMLDSQIELTEKGKKFFLAQDYSLYEDHIDEKLICTPDKIYEKKLFYSDCVKKQIDDLRSSLSQTRFRQIQNRLRAKGLPCGIAVILHGAPGCGKTETAYQIARKTGRSIIQVDISDTKSCWFGESEKKIKQLFSNYKSLCKKAKVEKTPVPILLFNECDAVFSKRKDVTDSNTAQVENAIQNIILQEMETLDGILIATTNRTDNLDPAFERRFLFKIHFENPSYEAKCGIWKDKLKWLSKNDIQALASKYSFSGGEIDNIVRKSLMQEIVTGSRPSFKEIDEMCINEKLYEVSSRKIGFAG